MLLKKTIIIWAILCCILTGCKDNLEIQKENTDEAVNPTQSLETSVEDGQMDETQKEMGTEKTETTVSSEQSEGELSKHQIYLVSEMLSSYFSNRRSALIRLGRDEDDLNKDQDFALGMHRFRIYREKESGRYFLGYETDITHGDTEFPISDTALVWDEGRDSVHMVWAEAGDQATKFELSYEGWYEIKDSNVYEAFDEKETMAVTLWRYMLRSIGIRENVNIDSSYSVEVVLENYTQYETDYVIQAAYDQNAWLTHQIIGDVDYENWENTLRADYSTYESKYKSEDRSFVSCAENGYIFINGNIETSMNSDGDKEGVGKDLEELYSRLWGSALDAVGQMYLQEMGEIYGRIAGEIYLLGFEEGASGGQDGATGTFTLVREDGSMVEMVLSYGDMDLRTYSIKYIESAEGVDDYTMKMKFDLLTSKNE